MHAATGADLLWIAPAAVQAHLVESDTELAEIHELEPWRIRVSDEGEAALLDRWRSHGRDCAILGLWCTPRRVPPLVSELARTAQERGFARLIAPPQPEKTARAYRDAGMKVLERVAVMRRAIRAGDLRDSSEERFETDGSTFVLRTADPSDLHAIIGLDALCFDEFWRYDLRSLERLSRTGHLVVAEEEEELIGYTLATAYGADGSLGRLAVRPSARGCGRGRSLALHALGWLADQGVRSVVLSVQELNEPARELYRSIGFEVVPGWLVASALDLPHDRSEER